MARAHTVAVRAAGNEVAAISSSSVESAERAAAELSIESVFATATDLIASDSVDVVHICTPNRFHFELAEAAIAAGKPVVCEKPLSMTLAEADRMVSLADARGVATAVPFIYRYFGAATRMHAQLRALAQPGAGSSPLTSLDGAYLQDWLLAPGSTNWRVDPALGGESRVFADVGIHWCDLMEFVTRHRISRLRATFTNLYADRPTEDTAEVEFETDLGARGSLVVSQVAEGHANDLEFRFRAGEQAIEWTQADSSEYQPAFNRFMADAYASFTSVRFPSRSVTPQSGSATPNLPTFADGRRAASLIDAVVRSARSGEWVTPA